MEKREVADEVADMESGCLQLELSFGNKAPLGTAFSKNLVESRNLKELYD
ncbi:MAG: hypothetical protein ABSC04_09000 [Syntrophobacteraceae bacterium]|jgi:hypothetical protein